ncbi:hypothetical protein [Castellaniella sp.]|uniref:hypothetical protein n=1 Tax=Castellaniella sp. TaxID=1955812 RepID=UPI002AFF234C|nr:hypothetical protein [Castellaniella sp.]
MPTPQIPIWARDLPLLLAEVYAKMSAPLAVPEHRLFDLVEWVTRLPAQNPRRVHISRTLGRKILTPYEWNGIRRIIQAMTAGGDLRPFLGWRTRAIRDRRRPKGTRMNHDLFFSDWGLLHFHLGADFANTGRHVARTRRVMISYLTDEDAYLLDVAVHGKGAPEVWGNEHFLEVLERDWPEILAPFELRGVLGIAADSPIEPMQHVQAREAGVTTPVRINDRYFIAPGLGIATDCTSVRAVRTAGRIRRELDSSEKLFRARFPDEDAVLFVGRDAAVGFFVPSKNVACRLLSQRTVGSVAAEFFRRLLEESAILARSDPGAIWVPAGTPPSACLAEDTSSKC